MRFLKSHASLVSAFVLMLMLSNASQAGMVFEENFNDNVADNWTLEGNTIVDANPQDGSGALFIETRSAGNIASLPMLDLRFIAAATISFDFTAPPIPNPQATRIIFLEFFDGSAWQQLARIAQNIALVDNDPSSDTISLAYTVSTGFSDANQFRFFSRDDSGAQRFGVIDNVSISAVSAPQTAALFAAFGLLLMAYRRKVN